jgi:hypothetical protein
MGKELDDWNAGLSPWQRWIIAQAIDHHTLSRGDLEAAYTIASPRHSIRHSGRGAIGAAACGF